MCCGNCKEEQKVIISSSYSDDGPFTTEEENNEIKSFYEKYPKLKTNIEEIKAENEKRKLSLEKENLQKNKEEQETMHYHKNSWMQTFTGKKFYPLNPNPNDIDIIDIAHSLSMICRFTGHSNKFYSVGQHSILASYICDSDDRLDALLHDATEAYIADLARPLKRSGGFDNYIKYENNLMLAIAQKFGIKEEMPVSVRKADNILLATEARDLMSPLLPNWFLDEKPLPFKIEPLSQEKVEKMFLERYFELTNK